MRNDSLLPFCRVKYRRVADFVMMLCLFHGYCPMKGYRGVQALAADASLNHRLNRLSLSSLSPPWSLLVVGLGRVGLEVAQQALVTKLQTCTKDGSSDSIPAFTSVWGTVRDIAHDSSALEDGVQRVFFQHLADMERHEVDKCFHATHVLITLPAVSLQDNAELVQRQTVEILDTLKNSLISKSSCCWIGVISTTSVYGNHDGAWVTEDSECRSDDKMWLLWEDYWKEIAVSEHRKAPIAVSVFRCAGIYGGSQSALHTVYRNGLHLSPAATMSRDVDLLVTNRIHVFDLARAVISSMLMEAAHDRTLTEGELDYPLRVRTYNLADNLPASRQHVLEYASNLLLGVSPPDQTTLPLGVAPLSTGIQTRDEKAASKRARRRRTDHKLVSNQRLREELLPQLMYPTYKEGLQAILNDRRNPWWKLSINDD